MIEFKEGVQQF